MNLGESTRWEVCDDCSQIVLLFEPIHPNKYSSRNDFVSSGQTARAVAESSVLDVSCEPKHSRATECPHDSPVSYKSQCRSAHRWTCGVVPQRCHDYFGPKDRLTMLDSRMEWITFNAPLCYKNNFEEAEKLTHGRQVLDPSRDK